MYFLLDALLEMDSYKRLLQTAENEKSSILATGVCDGAQSHIAAALFHHADRSVLFVASSEERADEIYEDLRFLCPNAMRYPARDIIFYNAEVHSKDIDRQRFMVVNALLNGPQFVVLSLEALFDPLMPKGLFQQHVLTVQQGDHMDRDAFLRKLYEMGYEHTELVEGVGQYAMRGAIVDIFSPTEETPVRFEFWDDEIDSIRQIDTLSQRSIDNMESTVIFPVTELIYGEQEALAAAGKIRREYEKLLESYEKSGKEDLAQALRQAVGENLVRLEEEKRMPVSGFFHFFYEKPVSLLDYFPQDTLTLWDEPQRGMEVCEKASEAWVGNVHSRIQSGMLLPSQSNMFFSFQEIKSMFHNFSKIYITSIAQTIKGMTIKETIHFSCKSLPVFANQVDLFCQEVENFKKEGYRVLILTGSQIRGENLLEELARRDIPAVYRATLDSSFSRGSVTVSKGKLRQGLSYPMIGFVVFSDQELLLKSKKKRRVNSSKGRKIESFTDLKAGDYVVHESHGVGIFQGLEKILVDGIQKDYIKIQYASNGNLFLPVNQLDLVQKYVGGDSAHPKLNKLGGQDWGKIKTRVKGAVSLLAKDLVQLYAKRQQSKGVVYGKDTIWQREFEEAFPFDETQDQLDAIEDVKKDMERGKVMDRLLCGDVGYGKTEVAIRAAFKVAQEGKQTAYLAPTTILAQQHYNTFTQRMMQYPIRIDLLSRFRSQKEQQKTLQDLKAGFVDILIGTHRLLSKDVMFRDLGLVIVDEEQRFGVGHKEKLKNLQKNVNVLTLTATPIPRTLHMSLAGIRDMSVLEEPPLERRPIQTYVIEKSFPLIQEAVKRELDRGGQVYYLYNRVQTIGEETARLRKILPDVSIAYAHGQMTERELETIMGDFIEGVIDVLVCTTIIETGLDIPNVNTIVIQDADHMGLSQLYQLRGRVGRSNKTAYAYLMYQRNKVLPEIAEKRLQTIREFTEFGSGYKIAMRDLEIRGAGNLLGEQQHGHMDAVGYDMYCKLLQEAVKRLQGEEVKESFETSIDLEVNAFLPSYYIKNQEQKLEAYKKISMIETRDDFLDMQDELIDRYGEMPKPAGILLELAWIKAQAHQIGVSSISQKREDVQVVFCPDAPVDPMRVQKLVVQNGGLFTLSAGINPVITIKKGATDPLPNIKRLLQGLLDFPS